MQTLNLIQYSSYIVIIIAEACLRLRHDMHEYKVKDTFANIAIAVTAEEKQFPEQRTNLIVKRNCKKCRQCSLSCVTHLKKLDISLTLS